MVTKTYCLNQLVSTSLPLGVGRLKGMKYLKAARNLIGIATARDKPLYG